MTLLTRERCTPVDEHEAPMSDFERRLLLVETPAWRMEWKEGAPGLKRVFHIPDYRKAMDFVWRLAELSQAQDHHPSITLDVGAVSVRWSTHSVDGLHRNDFVMAAKTDELHAPAFLPGFRR